MPGRMGLARTVFVIGVVECLAAVVVTVGLTGAIVGEITRNRAPGEFSDSGGFMMMGAFLLAPFILVVAVVGGSAIAMGRAEMRGTGRVNTPLLASTATIMGFLVGLLFLALGALVVSERCFRLPHGGGSAPCLQMLDSVP